MHLACYVLDIWPAPMLMFVCGLQIIKEFCTTVGAPPKQAQQVIRLAKKNGEWLGFLA